MTPDSETTTQIRYRGKKGKQKQRDSLSENATQAFLMIHRLLVETNHPALGSTLSENFRLWTATRQISVHFDEGSRYVYLLIRPSLEVVLVQVEDESDKNGKVEQLKSEILHKLNECPESQRSPAPHEGGSASGSQQSSQGLVDGDGNTSRWVMDTIKWLLGRGDVSPAG